MLSKNVVIIYASIIVYTLCLFFLPLLLYAPGNVFPLIVFFAIALIPFFFIVFMGVFTWLFNYYHRTNKLPTKTFLVMQKVAYPLHRFSLMSNRIPLQPESDYAYTKGLYRTYLTVFSLVFGIVLLLASIIGFVLITLLNSTLPITVLNINYSYFILLTALWVLWVLLVVAQNAVFHKKIYDKDFD